MNVWLRVPLQRPKSNKSVTENVKRIAMKRLSEGQTKLLKVECFSCYLNLEVKAECYDMETPYIELLKDGEEILSMTDDDAIALIETLQKALSILPSSK